MYGNKLLDPEEQEAQAAQAAQDARSQVYGHLLLDDDPTQVEAPAAVASGPAAPSSEGPPPPPAVETLSVAEIQRRLAAQPEWWIEALRLEMTRPQVRTSAMRAIVRVAEQQGADPDTIAKMRSAMSGTTVVGELAQLDDDEDDNETGDDNDGETGDDNDGEGDQGNSEGDQ